jgi:phosphoribosylformylglycinamidine synthase
MAFAGGLGVDVDAGKLATDGEVSAAARLFGESAGRLLVEVEPDKAEAFEKQMGQSAFAAVGTVTDTRRVIVRLGEAVAIDTTIEQAKRRWQEPLAW